MRRRSTGLNSQWTRHLRVLRNGSHEVSLAYGPLIECLGRAWDWDKEVPAVQIFANEKKREAILVPFLVPKFPVVRRRIGVYRCFLDSNATPGTRAVRFCSPIFRRTFGLSGGKVYRVYVDRTHRYLRIPLRTPEGEFLSWKDH